jgi:hypothetical protein
MDGDVTVMATPLPSSPARQREKRRRGGTTKEGDSPASDETWEGGIEIPVEELVSDIRPQK